MTSKKLARSKLVGQIFICDSLESGPIYPHPLHFSFPTRVSQETFSLTFFIPGLRNSEQHLTYILQIAIHRRHPRQQMTLLPGCKHSLVSKPIENSPVQQKASLACKTKNTLLHNKSSTTEHTLSHGLAALTHVTSSDSFPSSPSTSSSGRHSPKAIVIEHILHTDRPPKNKRYFSSSVTTSLHFPHCHSALPLDYNCYSSAAAVSAGAAMDICASKGTNGCFKIPHKETGSSSSS